MSELLAVDGATLKHSSGSPISGGVFTIESAPSSKTKEDSAGIYTTPLLCSFSGGSASGFVSGTVSTVAPVPINASSQKTKDYDILVMRKGDSGTLVCQGTLTGGGVGPVSGGFEIDDPGQSKVSGE